MTALEATQRFFELYRRHDIDAMVCLFDKSGTIDYIPAATTGPASQSGRHVWKGLIEGFPDLTNEITNLYVGDNGKTVTAGIRTALQESVEGVCQLAFVTVISCFISFPSWTLWGSTRLHRLK